MGPSPLHGAVIKNDDVDVQGRWVFITRSCWKEAYKKAKQNERIEYLEGTGA